MFSGKRRLGDTPPQNTAKRGRSKTTNKSSLAIPPRTSPFQVRITAANSARLHAQLVRCLPNISLFSPDWFLFAFENYWFDEVETRLKQIDRRVAEEHRPLCPPGHRVWRWAELIPVPTDVRVAIVGQDPYTRLTDGERTPMADGLAFSVSREYHRRVKRLPPSLVNVLNAVRKAADTKDDSESASCVQEGNLESWCRQGVLLLNSVLTAPGGSGTECANSHKDFGWQFVTDAVIRRLGGKDMPHRVFFMLWGRSARDTKLPLIHRTMTDDQEGQKDSDRGTVHCVFECHHPSPLSVNRQGEFPHEQFTVCNTLLRKDGMDPIHWW